MNAKQKERLLNDPNLHEKVVIELLLRGYEGKNVDERADELIRRVMLEEVSEQ